jgi:16S rRNA (cytidine1402-2'-O)-methyltransferase
MTKTSNNLGRLYLVPAPLDFGCKQEVPLQNVMPLGTLHAAAKITCWICENAKTTRAYLKRIDACSPLSLPIQSQVITELPREVHKKGDHHGGFDAKPMLAAALTGQDIGLVSEAGMPAVADPGSSVVRAAHDLGIQVIALVGPVSLLLALASSGMKTGQTQLFIETPYRNAPLWSALVQNLQVNTRLSFSSGITLPDAAHRSAAVQQWRQLTAGQMPEGLSNQTPAVFAIGN